MAISPTLPDTPDPTDGITRENGSWFQLSLGTLSGRVQSGSDYLMVLGQLVSTDPATMLTGDYIEVTQEDVDLSAIDYITFPSQVIGMALVSASVAWQATIFVGTVVYAQKTITPNKVMEWSDFRVPVQLVTGTADVTIRLTLVEV